MTMDTLLRDQVVFHLTGRRALADEAVVRGMRPALLAPYRHLSSLRYDFPLVLLEPGRTDAVHCHRSLTDVIDQAIRAAVPAGPAGEGTRRRVLRIEREIRTRLARGDRGNLRELWDAIAAADEAADPTAARQVQKVRDALEVDGPLVDCDHRLPAHFVRHGWAVVQAGRARTASARIRSLVLRLEDILRADDMQSERAIEASALRNSFGSAHHGWFDFGAMSAVLAKAGRHSRLDARRAARIRQALDALRSQRFYATAPESAIDTYTFEFDSVTAALDAFRSRVPDMVRLLRALQVADLEANGDYVDDVHDTLIEAIDAGSLGPADLSFFPDYLVCLSAESARSHDASHLVDALSSDVPLKVVAQIDDLLEESALGEAHLTYGVRSAQLANAAMSLDGIFVLQTAASNLLQLRERVLAGLRYRGPALFSIYAPTTGSGALPPYLVSAAAMQSRAFPAFSFDPGAGPDTADRFALENNPQPERDWPVEPLRYADPDLQSVAEDVAFTFVDFALCDPRCGRHFAPAARDAWNGGMLSSGAWLEHPPANASTVVPYVLAVDDADLLCRLVVDEKLMRAAQRCRAAWHRLQELAGVHDPRADRRLAQERERWEAQHHREAELKPSEVEATAAPPPAAAPAAAATEAVERNPDEAYVETVRCSTCNECTTTFPRIFAYDENKQAYIKDLQAATYRQLVEAAESCQVSVIHPGKPRDASEPGLEELLERAKPFL